MIKVFVEGYCQNCSYFEPEVTKNERVETIKDPFTLTFHHEMVPVEKTVCDTNIYCKHRVKCESIAINIKTM